MNCLLKAHLSRLWVSGKQVDITFKQYDIKRDVPRKRLQLIRNLYCLFILSAHRVNEARIPVNLKLVCRLRRAKSCRVLPMCQRFMKVVLIHVDRGNSHVSDLAMWLQPMKALIARLGSLAIAEHHQAIGLV